MFDFDEWVESLEIVGDEAFLPGERRAPRNRGTLSPEARERKREQWRKWRERNRETWRQYKREWTRRKRAA